MNGSGLLERLRVLETELHRLATRTKVRPASCIGVLLGRRYGWKLIVVGKYAFTKVRRRRQRQSPNNRLQRTVERHRGRAASASFHYVLASLGRGQRAAAEPDR
jgi:hypothetical protein